MLYYIIFFMLFNSVFLESSDLTASKPVSQRLIPSAQAVSDSDPAILVNDAQLFDFQSAHTKSDTQSRSLVGSSQASLSDKEEVSKNKFDLTESFFDSTSLNVSRHPSNNSQQSPNNQPNNSQRSPNNQHTALFQRPRTSSNGSRLGENETEGAANPFSALNACLIIANRRHSRYNPNGLAQSQRRSLTSSQNTAAAAAAAIANDSTSDTDEENNQMNVQAHLEKAKEALRSLRQQSSTQDTAQKTNPRGNSQKGPLLSFVFPEENIQSAKQ